MLKDKLREFANEDLKLAREKGMITVFGTRAGTIHVSYSKFRNEYVLDCRERGWIISGPEHEMLKTLANSYLVEAVVERELKKVWRPM